MQNFAFTFRAFLVLAIVSSNLNAFSPGPKEAGVAFTGAMLENPRQHAEELIKCFSYLEIDSFVSQENAEGMLLLANAYASQYICNKESYAFDKELYRVKSIDIVFTKYPYHKKDWLTNYYDLLAWRLMELFAIDSTLNSADIEWRLVLQTKGKTAVAAKELFHGIAITLEPIQVLTEELPPTTGNLENSIPSGIQNGGFLMKEDRDPQYFRSPQAAEPIPGKVLRRNMDPKKLKCPTWR
jgi:hypothetical protein